MVEAIPLIPKPRLPPLTTRRCSALMDIASRSPGLGCQGLLGRFLDNYLVADSLATKLQYYFQVDTGQKSTDKIHVNQLIAAQRHFSLAFEDLRTKEIFLSGAGTGGCKSCRQLRNGYVHSLCVSDREEIEKRSKSLLIDLVDYLESYRSLCSPIRGGRAI
jgi:hypothetical protein